MHKKERDTHTLSDVDQSLEQNDYQTIRSDDALSEDPEFPAFVAKKTDQEAFSDVQRKKSEIKNSTIGGF